MKLNKIVACLEYNREFMAGFDPGPRIRRDLLHSIANSINDNVNIAPVMHNNPMTMTTMIHMELYVFTPKELTDFIKHIENKNRIGIRVNKEDLC